MTRIQMVKYLGQYGSLTREILELEQEAAYLRARLYAPERRVIDGLPRPKYRTDALGERVARLVDMENTIVRLLDRLYGRRQEIEGVIEALDSEQRRVIRLRYIKCTPEGRALTWEQIGKQMGYSSIQAHRIHDAAVRRLSE